MRLKRRSRVRAPSLTPLEKDCSQDKRSGGGEVTWMEQYGSLSGSHAEGREIQILTGVPPTKTLYASLRVYHVRAEKREVWLTGCR